MLSSLRSKLRQLCKRHVKKESQVVPSTGTSTQGGDIAPSNSDTERSLNSDAKDEGGKELIDAETMFKLKKVVV